MTQDWNRKASRLLVGRRIVVVRYMTEKEADHWMFDSRPLLIKLDTGLVLMPLRDDEGNDGGALFTSDEEVGCLPVL